MEPLQLTLLSIDAYQRPSRVTTFLSVCAPNIQRRKRSTKISGNVTLDFVLNI